MYSAPETGAAIRSIRLCSISFPHVRPDRAWRLDARMELNPLQNNAASACDPIHTLRDTETSVSVHPNTARADPSKAPCTVDTSLASALIGAGSRAYESSPPDSRTVESNGELSLKLIRERG